jgi:DNA processing protein
MTQDELLYALALQRVPNIGDVIAKKLLSACNNSPKQVFEAHKKKLLEIDGIGTYTLKELHNPEHLREAEEELTYIVNNAIDFAFYTDAHYPERLKHCIDGPILLFYNGNIDFKKPRFISIVGTRQISSYGKVFCEQFIEELALLQPTIVSGFAYGVDIMSQKLAAKHGLQTIGCLAHGLNQIYPKTHAKYAKQVLENGGFVTDFWSNSKPDRENFLKRNRIIAGLSEATIVIESAEKGGSLVTASIANSYNREVFAVPGRANDKYSVGCNNLIKKQQAFMLTSAADLVYMLNWKLEEENKTVVQKQLFVELDDVEQKVYTYLQKNGKQLLDVIAMECNIPVHKVATLLLSMELKGVIRPLPGKLFEAI